MTGDWPPCRAGSLTRPWRAHRARPTIASTGPQHVLIGDGAASPDMLRSNDAHITRFHPVRNAVMVQAVCTTSLALAVASFVFFVASAVWAAVLAYRVKEASRPRRRRLPAWLPRRGRRPRRRNVPELTELLKAATGLIDAIVKAGPSLAGLVASIAFLAIAAWAASGGHGQ